MTIATTKSDTQVKTDVLNELRWDGRVNETDVGVQVHKGVVTLTGNVNAYFKKIAAVEAAHRVGGVLDVVDNMTVKLLQQWERSDEDIASAARAALQWDVMVPEERITTTVSSGVVQLDGSVDSWTQRWDAEAAVQRLTGVKDVVNMIMVAAKPANPEKLKLQIEAALERQAEREARRIGIGVRDGVVTLTGTVRSWAEKNAIGRVVGYASGVRRVDDELTVDPYS